MTPPGDGSIRSATHTLLLLFAALCGCQTGPPARVSVQPFFEYQRDEQRVSVTVRPLATRDVSPEKREFTLLWPLYRSTTTDVKQHTWLFPAYNRTVFEPPGKPPDHDSFLLPLLFWGNDPEEGKYFLFFPFAGHVKGKLAQERLDTVLWPLYMRVKNDERYSHHLLFPFINWIDAPHDTGFRLLPFYSHYREHTRDGRLQHERRSYLWPFVVIADEHQHTERPQKVRWYWPFWASTESSTISRRAVLWPLLRWEHDRQHDRKRLRIFPFSFGKSPELEQFDLWPLYGRRKKPGYYRQFFLFPIQRYEYHESNDLISENFWVLPLVWRTQRRHLAEGTHESHTRVWPLCSWHRERDGHEWFAALDLLPFRDPPHFDRVYARLWRLFVYHDYGPDRGREWDLLWGLARGSRTPSRSEWSALWGLVARETGPDESRWRILYIPF